MRLYLKFFALLLLAASLQHYVLGTQSFREIWFGVRCDIAYIRHDEAAIDRLVAEAPSIMMSYPHVNAAG